MTSVDVEYNALIHQMSGEDWRDVAITLSTASPGLNASAPALGPFVVDLHQAQAAPAPLVLGERAAVLGRYKDIQAQRHMAAYANRIAIDSSENVSTNWTLNAAANACQTLEILEGHELAQWLAEGDSACAEGPSLSYPLEPKVSLASRPDQQLVRIASMKLASAAYHVATPVLSGFVYREAEIVNSSAFDMLGGSMSVYLDGAFVGRGELDSVARGQTFVVGLGVDPQVRTRREQIARSERIQGGNELLTFSYRLVVENYKTAPVDVRLQDRVPHADREDSLNVTLGEMSVKLSENPAYLRLERPLGILRWDIEVPASASGEKASVLTYSFTLEHDRNLELAAAGDETNQRSQEEFKRLLKHRQAK
jgi:uncharacterized protein (TIGR02231 family)